MELDNLKSTWKNTQTPEKAETAIIEMLKESKHPVLKGLRKQLLIEMVGWTAFVLLAYSMFDADQKPLWLNFTTLGGILLPIIHHLIGYQLAKKPMAGANIKLSLQHYILQIKNYAVLSVVLRILLFSGILLFFFYGLTLNAPRLTSLIVISVIFLIQLGLMILVWRNRLIKLNFTLSTLD